MLDLPVFTAGNRPAQAALSAGYRNVRPADGDVHDLERLVCDAMPPGRTIFHLSARQPAGDLVGNLKRTGLEAKKIVVYEARDVPVTELVETLPSLENIMGILIHSPHAGRNVRGRWWFALSFLQARFTAFPAPPLDRSRACETSEITAGGVRVRPGAQGWKTAASEPVRLLDHSLYEIISTGELLKRRC